MMNDVFQAAVAVVTRGNQYFRSPGFGIEQLLALDPVSRNPGHFMRRSGIDHTSPGTAAIVVFAVGVHLDEFFTNGVDYVSRLFVNGSNARRR